MHPFLARLDKLYSAFVVSSVQDCRTVNSSANIRVELPPDHRVNFRDMTHYTYTMANLENRQISDAIPIPGNGFLVPLQTSRHYHRAIFPHESSQDFMARPDVMRNYVPLADDDDDDETVPVYEGEIRPLMRYPALARNLVTPLNPQLVQVTYPFSEDQANPLPKNPVSLVEMAMKIAYSRDELRLNFPFFAALPHRFTDYTDFVKICESYHGHTYLVAEYYTLLRNLAHFQGVPYMYTDSRARKIAALRRARALSVQVRTTLFGKLEASEDYIECFKSHTTDDLLKALQFFPLDVDAATQYWFVRPAGVAFLLYHLITLLTSLALIFDRLTTNKLIEFDRPIFYYDTFVSANPSENWDDNSDISDSEFA